jgi:D-3-phosphoglycerate dehydrogenase
MPVGPVFCLEEGGMFKVLITGSIHPHKEAEREFLKDIATVVVDESNDRSGLLELVEDADAIMTDFGRIDRDVFERAKRLKVVVEYGIGVNNIDLEAATDHGVMVCNVPDASIREVAEHTLALVFCLARQIIKMDSDVRESHVWDFNRYEPLKLEDKWCGLIGFGKIGRAVAELFTPLFSRVLVYSPSLDQEEARRRGLEPSPLDTLLKESDIISIHAPLTDKTRNLISREQLNRMKRTALLVNVSRGGIINERDLYEALKNRTIRGAALDVLADEPQDPYHLGSLGNIIITPHAAWKSEEASYHVELAAAREVKHVLTGNPPMNLVNKAVQEKARQM